MNKQYLVEIEATNECNAHCVHCPRPEIARGQMERGTFDNLVKWLAPRAWAWDFAGMGEPLLHPHIVDFVQRLSRERKPVFLTTNGSLLTTEMSVKLKRAGLEKVFVSFNAHTPALFSQITGGLGLLTVSRNIQTAVDVGLRVVGHIILNKLNVDYESTIRDYLYSLGVSSAIATRVHNRGGHLHAPDIELARDADGPPELCKVYDSIVSIGYDGTLLPCCHDIRHEYPLPTYWQHGVKPPYQPFYLCKKCNDLLRGER